MMVIKYEACDEQDEEKILVAWITTLHSYWFNLHINTRYSFFVGNVPNLHLVSSAFYSLFLQFNNVLVQFGIQPLYTAPEIINNFFEDDLGSELFDDDSEAYENMLNTIVDTEVNLLLDIHKITITNYNGRTFWLYKPSDVLIQLNKLRDEIAALEPGDHVLEMFDDANNHFMKRVKEDYYNNLEEQLDELLLQQYNENQAYFRIKQAKAQMTVVNQGNGANNNNINNNNNNNNNNNDFISQKTLYKNATQEQGRPEVKRNISTQYPQSTNGSGHVKIAKKH